MKIKVMAVDDEPAILDLLKTLLESLGCEVQAFVDSREAAKRLEVDKVDGLFIDARMPYLDGFELAKQTRRSRLNSLVPIVMVTALDDGETMRKGFHTGITFFLGKPFTRDRVYNLYLATRGPMLREKQRYLRLPYLTAVECTWGPEKQYHFRTGSMDISEGGIMLNPAGGLVVGQELDLSFSLPEAPQPMKVHARVVRNVPPRGIGLMFLSLGAQEKEALQHYIAASVED